jgi:hypothetical protein
LPVSLRKELLLFALLSSAWPTQSSAGSYVFVFATGSASFNPRLSDNQTTLQAVLALLSDFRDGQGFRFVIEGALAARCAPSSDCEALLVSRINSLTDAINQADGGAGLSDGLGWRRAPNDSVPPDTLRLALEPKAAKPLSPKCPVVLEISDPRLPSWGSHQDWLNVSGMVEIPVTPLAEVRVHAVDGAPNVSARQRLVTEQRELIAHAREAQWRAVELLGSSGVAEIRFTNDAPDAPRVGQR